ncbi:MAG: hypothetical protein ACRD93_05125 [Nitrososphaeraceae archaeon]
MSTVRETSGFEQYRKTCSIIFGNATASQLKYLNASIELQQTALTSCDGIISNQIKWLEDYVNNNKGNSSAIDAFLKNYTNIVSMGMNFISISYDFATSNIQSYTKILESLNGYFFGINTGEGEIEGLPVSKS